MGKKKSILNVSVAIFFKIALLVLTIITKRFLIDYVGNDANGVNALYASIIGFLSIAELGMGTAITFSMYKPIVDNDKEKVSALYCYYKKFYLIVSVIIALLGLCVTPFLPYLAKDYNANFSLYLTFIIMLISVVLSYMFSAKTALINAYKNNYISTTIFSISQLIGYLIQMAVLYFFKSFELYLVAKIVVVLIEWLLTEIYTKKTYKEIISVKKGIDAETKQEVSKNTRAMLFHKIGGLLVNSTDSIIISALISVSMLGKYNNYSIIASAMMGFLALFFTPLTSTFGQLCAKGDIKEDKKYFRFFYILNYTLGIIFFLGFYGVIDDVIAICFGSDLILGQEISLIVTINYFIQFMRQTVLTFKDATGCFYNDRYKPLIEGLLNIVLSLILAYFMGVVGVIVATIITNIIICDVVEPYVLYKNAFKQSPKKYYLINYSLILIFGIGLTILHFSKISLNNIWLDLILNGLIAIAIATAILLIIVIFDKKIRQDFLVLFKKIFNKKNKNNEVLLVQNATHDNLEVPLISSLDNEKLEHNIVNKNNEADENDNYDDVGNNNNEKNKY